MARHDPTNDLASALGKNLADRRLAIGFSPQELARASGLRKRQILGFERGRELPSDLELIALADALDSETAELVPAGYHFVHVRDGDDPARRSEVAVDALLREYLSMLLELRNVRTLPLSTVRHDDLVELAEALGGAPDAIEAKIAALLETDPAWAHAAREAIFPSDNESRSFDGPFVFGAAD